VSFEIQLLCFRSSLTFPMFTASCPTALSSTPSLVSCRNFRCSIPHNHIRYITGTSNIENLSGQSESLFRFTTKAFKFLLQTNCDWEAHLFLDYSSSIYYCEDTSHQTRVFIQPIFLAPFFVDDFFSFLQSMQEDNVFRANMYRHFHNTNQQNIIYSSGRNHSVSPI
jgi:hypothetical protein